MDKVGFDSGFKIVDAILPDPPKFTLRINDTDPIFFYCGAPGSCIDWQMVGVINPNASVSLEVQKQYAANSSFMLLPGEDWPNEADTPFTTSTSAAPTGSSTTGSSAGSSSTSEATESHSHGLSTGAIAGIAIGIFHPCRLDLLVLTSLSSRRSCGCNCRSSASFLLRPQISSQQ